MRDQFTGGQRTFLSTQDATDFRAEIYRYAVCVICGFVFVCMVCVVHMAALRIGKGQ